MDAMMTTILEAMLGFVAGNLLYYGYRALRAWLIRKERGTA